MKRGWAICHAGHWNPATAVDRVRIAAAGTPPDAVALVGESGTEFVLDLGAPAVLGDGDGIILDDGSVVLVSGGVPRAHHHDHDGDHDH